MTAENPSSERAGEPRLPRIVASALHLIVGVFQYAPSGLLAPMGAVVVLGLIWLGLFVFLWRWRPRQPWLLLLVPVVAIVVWIAVITFGDAVLGWTA